MTKEQSEIMIGVLLRGLDETAPIGDDSPFASERGWNAVGAANVILLPRLAKAGVTVSEALFVVVCSWVGGRAGDLTLWAYTLLEISRRCGRRHLTTNELVLAFPMGVPTEAAMGRIWAAQKQFDGAQDNWLDTDAAWILDTEAPVA